MRFEELSYGSDGGDVAMRLGRRLTVIAGLDAPARQQWMGRVLGVLHGTPAGCGTSLVLQDGSSRQVRLTRDSDGSTRAVDIESGEDLTSDLGGDGSDWLALLGLDHTAARAMMIVEAAEDIAETEAVGTIGGDEELAETRELLAQVEAEYEEAQAQRRALQVVNGRLAGIEERLRRRAVEELEAARVAFGDRPRLDPPAMESGLLLPAEAPAGLEERHQAYLAAARHRAEAAARLDEATPDMAPPSVPWVPTLARMDLVELWARAERLQSAMARVTEIALTGIHGDTVARIEAAHAEVERAEIRLEQARFTNRAARRHLAEAQEAERQILARAGFEGWLGFRLWRADVRVEPEIEEPVQAAELELQRAADAWTEVAGAVEVEAALAVREEVESHATHLARVGSEATEAACRDALEKAGVAYLSARTALLEACGPFAVELELAPKEIAALVELAIDARLQRALEVAEAAEEAARTGTRETGASAPGTHALWQERAGLLEELGAIGTVTARAESLAERGDALRRRISVLEASTRRLLVEDPEMALLSRFAVARRVGPRGEPLPLLFDDALVRYRRAEKWSLLELLARLGEATQVVYLTDDPEVAHWASIRSRAGGVVLLDTSPPPVTATCRDCGEGSVSLVHVRGADLCTSCALGRVGLGKRSARR